MKKKHLPDRREQLQNTSFLKPQGKTRSLIVDLCVILLYLPQNNPATSQDYTSQAHQTRRIPSTRMMWCAFHYLLESA